MNTTKTLKAREETSKMLWYIRYKLQTTQKELSEKLGIHPCTFTAYITKTKTATLENYLKIKELYETLRSV